MIAVYSPYDENLNNPAQPLHADALKFLRTELAKRPIDQPTIVATHLCFDAITNRDELVDAIGNANVLAILGGHYHQAKVDRYRGLNFVQLPSPAPNSPDEITVIRITSDRLLAIPFDYKKNAWVMTKGKMLDKAIKGPVETKAQESPAAAVK